MLDAADVDYAADHSIASRARGFTLVELLVVIGIIALLVSILLPVLSRAREAANRTKCLSNVRQIATAMVAYANDNAGLLPGTARTGNDDSDFVWWHSSRIDRIGQGGIGPYLRLTPGNLGILRCPSDGAWRTRGGYTFSYSMNWLITSKSNAAGYMPAGFVLAKKLTQVRDASEKVLVYEEDERSVDDGNGALWFHPSKPNRTNLMALRHDEKMREVPDDVTVDVPVPNPAGRGNAAFCDGHAAYVLRGLVHSREHAVPDPDAMP